MTTVAGGGFGRSLQFGLGTIASVAADSAGNVYAGDSSNHIVLKISPAGELAVVAGNGVAGFSGDEGPATAASLNTPIGVAVDGGGNLYIADSGNARIRKVARDGTVTTLAGNGVFGYSGDGGSAAEASLSAPLGVAVDSSGNVYIADTLNNRIRKVSLGVITTVAGSGHEGFSGDGGPATGATLHEPYGVAADPAGNLYIADTGNDRIRKVSEGVIHTMAGSGIRAPWGGFSGDGSRATTAMLNQPGGVAVDREGNIFIADGANHRVRKVSASGIITTLAGSGEGCFSGDGGPASGAALHQPGGLAVDGAGNLYIADTFNHRIRKVSPGGRITTLAGAREEGLRGEGLPALGARLDQPEGVALDTTGDLYIAETGANRVRRVSPEGFLSTVAGSGSACFAGDEGPAADASLHEPRGLAVNFQGEIFVADTGNHRIRRISRTGIISTVAGNGSPGFEGDDQPAVYASLWGPAALVADGAGNLYIADTLNNRVRKATPGGLISSVAGDGRAARAPFQKPVGMALDADGNLYIADSESHSVRKVSPEGKVTTVAGNQRRGFSGDGGAATSASLNNPTGVALDAATNLYIADTLNHRIRTVTPGGTITTVAGTGVAAFSGDGGPSRRAALNRPAGLAVDPAGNVYIADSKNDRIRKLFMPPSFSVFPAGLRFSETTSQQVKLRSSIAGLPWQVTGISAGWLSVWPDSGRMPAVISVSANPANLAPGIHEAIIQVSAPAATPSGATVPVTLIISPKPP